MTSLKNAAPCSTDVMNARPDYYRDLKVREERKERLAPLELLDLLVPKDPPGMTVQRGTL